MKNRAYIKRPLGLGTLFYILGLIGGELHYNIMQLSLFFIVLIIGLFFLSLFYNKKLMAIYLFLTCLGVGSMLLNPVIKEERLLAKQDGAKLTLQGEILEVKEYEYGTQYIIQACKESPIQNKIKAQVSKGAQIASEGDIVIIDGIVDPLSFPRNPGAFNERSYLMIRGVSTKIKAKTITITSTKEKKSLFKKIQDYYSKTFELILPWQEAQIMKAMLLGDKLFLSKEIQTLYKDVGIAHVLAISGLHISIITGVIWWGLKKTGLNIKIQAIIVLGVLWTYAGLTGFAVSITRAAIMMSVIIGGTLLEEKPDPITSWSFAGLILLLYNKLYLWDIGFQLSFVAVGSLILLTPFFKRIFIIPDHIRHYVAPIIAVTVGTMPIIAYHYYIITPISILMNLLLIPLITLVVIVGFLAMLIAPIHLLLGKIVIGSGYYLLIIVEKISKIGLSIPFSTIIVGQPGLLELVAYLLFIGLIIGYLHASLQTRKIYRKQIFSFGFLLALIICVKRMIPKDLEVTFLDVGQGDCIIVTTPNHKTFVIDGGLGGNGKKIEQYLKYKGIQKIHGAILSHAHSDHMDGLGELALSSYKIDQLFLSDLPYDDVHFKAFYDIINFKAIPMHKLKAQDFIKSKDVLIECIFPFKDLNALQGNDSSLVLILKHGGVSYYFTGDIEGDYEKEASVFMEKNLINILKVPHHGSNTSSSQELITKLGPDLAIISCGKNNIYNHPHPKVIERYGTNNVPIQITKDVGAIMTYSNKKTVKIKLMEDKRMLWR